MLKPRTKITASRGGGGGGLRWTSIPSRRDCSGSNASSHFMLQKLELSAGADEPPGLFNFTVIAFSYYSVNSKKWEVIEWIV